MGEIIASAGPFTAPLCGAMALAIAWILKDRADEKAKKEVAEKDAAQLRDKRAEDLQRFATELAEIGEASRVVMRDYCVKMDAQLAGAGR